MAARDLKMMTIEHKGPIFVFVLFCMKNKKQEEKEAVKRGKPRTDVHKHDHLHH